MSVGSENYFLPLRWETAGEEWWFASPIDWAAANGCYELVRELVLLDGDQLAKLTSLSRIRRLECLWDDVDDRRFKSVAKSRSKIAHKFLRESERNRGHNSLIRAGYGGWLLYSAAAAGDAAFAKELLGRDPLLVFGGGEYGVSDVLYAAARSRSCRVFRLVFNSAVSAKKEKDELFRIFRWEITNRAVHAAARGGSWEILREGLCDGSELLNYRDVNGSTVLHAAAAAGRIEVVKNLISSFQIINSIDNEGNTALNIAAFHGHLPVVKHILTNFPSAASLTNNNGDTFLHMAIYGFKSRSFRSMKQQSDLMKALILSVDEDIINVQNMEGRAPIHSAVAENLQCEIVEMMLSIPYIDLNACDSNGNTPLDLLIQRPSSPSKEILIKKIRSAGGGVSSSYPSSSSSSSCFYKQELENTHPGSYDHGSRSIIIPGTCFGIPDSEVLLSCAVCEDKSISSCEISSAGGYDFCDDVEALSTTTSTAELKHCSSSASKWRDLGRKLLGLLWPGRKRNGDDGVSSICVDPYRRRCVPLRQQFSNGRRRRVHPKSPSSSSASHLSSCAGNKRIVVGRGEMAAKRKHGSFNLRMMNAADLCSGSEGLAAIAVEN